MYCTSTSYTSHIFQNGTWELVRWKTTRMLQTQDFKSESRERILYWINIRELNGVLGTMYLSIYTN